MEACLDWFPLFHSNDAAGIYRLASTIVQSANALQTILFSCRLGDSNYRYGCRIPE